MDEHQFDDLIKRVANTSRRQILSGLLGGVATAVGLHDVDAGKKQDKKGHNKKRVRASAPGGGASCTHGRPCAAGNCCPDEKCVNGTCAVSCKGKGKGKACPTGTTCCNGGCVPICTAPDVPDPITCACSACEPITCSTNQVQDPGTCQCACPNNCSPGQL
jgi:hypothetical protein